MSQADDTSDLIDNNNHIIASLQNHETKITRQEAETKQLKEHIQKLEMEIFTTLNRNEVFTNMFAIKTFASSTTRHLQRFQDDSTPY